MKTTADKKSVGYWFGNGKLQKQFNKLHRTELGGTGNNFFKAHAIYRDHFNNGSWNTLYSSVADLREANISNAKAYIAALDRIEECLKAYTEFEEYESDICSECGQEHEREEKWEPDQYNEAFETMMDVVVKHESRVK